MSGSLSPRVPGLLALAGASVMTGLASGRPELVVLAAPLLLLVGVGLVLAEEPRLIAEIGLERTRLLEGEHVTATVTLRNEGAGAVELELAIARTKQLAVAPGGSLMLRLAAGENAELLFSVRAERWGAHAIGPVVFRGRDPLGVLSWRGVLGERVTLRAFPREQRLRELVAPLRTQPFLGAHVARARGEGIEFADIRPFAPGDRVRRVNWRATARRDALYVTERHPEHASDVVLLLDTFAEAREAASGTLDAAVRAAASLARSHLARRDRVALVDFGGTLQWLEPAFGTTQLYRIIDARERDRFQLCLAGGRKHPPQAVAPGRADRRCHPTARRALDPSDHRSAHARLRPDRDRGVTARAHISRSHRCRRPRLSPLGASARGVASPPAIPRYRRRAMGPGQQARARVGGGELIPPFSPAHHARVAVALVAVALDIAMGALVATDAGAAADLAWYGTAVSVVILVIGLVAASSSTVQSSIALLGALLLLRHQDRLVLAPLYGACLLALGELGQRSLELRGLERVGSGVVRARLAAVLALAGLGACGAAVAAIAVTIAPGRSVGLSALGTVAVLGSCATIVMLIRRRHPQNRGDVGLPDTPGGP